MKNTKIFLILFFLSLGISSGLLAADWTNYTTANSGLISNDVRVVCVDLNGVKWFGTAQGLVRFDGSSWNTFQVSDTTIQTLPHNSIRDIAFEVTSYGPEIWVATDSGITVISVPLELDGISMATPYRVDNTGLVSNRVRTAVVDYKGKKWFATDSGLASFSGFWQTGWKAYTDTNSVNALSNRNVLSVGMDTTGWKYIGTSGGGVSRLFDNSVDAVSSASPYRAEWTGLLSDSIYTAYATIANSDTIQWFGTAYGAARHLGTKSKENWELFTTFEGLINDTVQVITADNLGQMWFGTRSGVTVLQDLKCTSLTVADGLIDNDIRDIAFDQDGSVWFATPGGISHFTGQISSIKPTMQDNRLSRTFKLNPSYPNPFNSTTTISYELYTAGWITLKIYNVKGQVVTSLVNGIQPAGKYQIIWNGLSATGSELPSGIYFYRLERASAYGALSEVQKMVLLK